MLDLFIESEKLLDLIDPAQDMCDHGDYGGFVEGLLWSEEHADLTFNTLANKKTWRFAPGEKATLLVDHTNMSNGMAYDHEGNILVCEQIGYRLARMDRDFCSYEIIADNYNGKPFNSPNDIVVHSNGTIYFTDPHFGRRPTKHGRFSSQPQEKQRVYGVDKHNNVFIATEETNMPNGLCFSHDENTIYFSETTTSEISAMTVMDDGRFTKRRVLAITRDMGKGGPDGIKVDKFGNLWCCAQGGIQIYEPDGSFLGLLRTAEASGNLCFGGKDSGVLYFGSDSRLMSVQTKV